MRRLLDGLLVVLVTGLCGCSTVKFTLPDATTGGTWMIKQQPFSPDSIFYCTSATKGPVQCTEAAVQ